MEPGHDLHRPDGGRRSTDVAEQVFDALVSQNTVGFALLDADLRYLTLNQRLADINGRPVADHLGRQVADVLPHVADAEVVDAQVVDAEVAAPRRAAPDADGPRGTCPRGPSCDRSCHRCYRWRSLVS